MESKNVRLTFIKNWMNAEGYAAGVEQDNIFRSEEDNEFNFTYRYITKNASVQELGEQFVHVLGSFNHRDFTGIDWKIEIIIPDRNAIIGIIALNNNLLLLVNSGDQLTDESSSLKTDARFAIVFEDLRLLTNFETDFASVMNRNKRLDHPEKPLIRPMSDLLFGTYNLYHLNPIFKNSIIEHLYKCGKVVSLSGAERFIYPWAISADIGNVLYKLIDENNSKKSLEIGLAYGLSALFMCQAHKNKGRGYHTAVDPCQTVEFQSIGVDQIKKSGLNSYFRLLEAKDYDILPALVKEEEKFDFIFIDGLHMHDYVVIDYFYSDLLLEVNGILVFDDCHAPGVTSAVAYFEDNRNYEFIAEHSDHRIRVYRKTTEDSRTINDSNYHVDYFAKYAEIARADKASFGLAEVDSNLINQDIAIVGIDGLLPKNNTIEEFWQSIADERILYERYADSYLYTRQTPADNSANLVGGMLESPFNFDPDFFQISHREAELMDPQLRQLLMSVYSAIEDAGYRAKQLREKRVGVFIGSEGSEYNELHRAHALAEGYFLNHAGSCIANRISHYFDFTGPSEVINTMCSSGAFCLYRAVELLRKGEIDFAVVGAAKMSFSSAAFDALTNLGITSATGRCYSFHRQSKGYIRSEGVVALVLTNAAMAEENKDYIYANIKAAAVNFNGKDGNSMFSPSKNGQKEVMKRCYNNAGISMADVDYIEAQGMGNEISDFVEFNAINEAFADLLQEHGINTARVDGPVISTIKPLLGHMECVSALGALLKILLSFRTRKIYRIPYLQQQDINPKIIPDNSYCELLTQQREVTADRPMRAALNSFGASGTNVHLLLEENIRSLNLATAAGDQEDLILVVSAKSADSLHLYLQKIAAFLSAARREASLADICHTFQHHREHYTYRVIFFLGKDNEENQVQTLLQLIAQHWDNKNTSALIRNNLESSIYHLEQDASEKEMIRNSDLYLDGLSWLAGEEIDWKKHDGKWQQRKIGRIPTYAFDLKPYQLERNIANVTGLVHSHRGDIHPLLHQNTSDLLQQSYRSIFNGGEFFLKDHQVNEQKILPAVAYLEMARAAVMQAAPAPKTSAILELRDLVWLQPLVVNEETAVSIALFADNDAEITYEVYSSTTTITGASAAANAFNEEQEIVHCQGKAAFVEKTTPAPLDIDKLQRHIQLHAMNPTDLYDAFTRLGIYYGAAHRGVTKVHHGQDELLAWVCLPDVVKETHTQYLLHPSLLDSALQASLVLIDSPLPQQPSLPFALDSMRIFDACPTDVVVWIRHTADSRITNRVVKLDIDLCDLSGNLLVEMRGFSSRVLDSDSVRGGTAHALIAAKIDKTTAPVPAKHVAQSSSASAALRADGVVYFQKIIAQILKTQPQKLEASTPFFEFGLDSILVVQLTNRLRETFADISSTLFFEVLNIDGIVDHFVTYHHHALIKATASTSAEVVHAAGDIPAQLLATPISERQLRRSRQSLSAVAQHKSAGRADFDIAIVGLSGRYPKAMNLSEFWDNLAQGMNCITEIPKDRWNWKTYFDPTKGKVGKIYTRWGGFIDDIDKFDPLFFKLTPFEAERMDPQERLFIQTCYQAMEDAGYTPENLAADLKVGVFVGVTNSMYNQAPDHFSFANRISYLFNFKGPSMAVDTACSSSLTAVHLAIESLHSGLSSCAIAGGVNIIIDPAHYLRLSEMAALSSGNQCKSFGEQADGFIDAEGVGAVVLKSLHQAEQDGDHIYGIIKGSSVNAGGKTNGYTVPNPQAQAALVTDALERAKVAAEDVSYIEAHGTGTALGDPIEIAGLSRAFRQAENKQFCAIGSLKSNIGHCESAAGIAGLTKVLLQLKYQQLVPSLHSAIANPAINFSQTPFKVQKQLEDWRRPVREVNGNSTEKPRIAGVSAFGMGGANAHIIVQEYIPVAEGLAHTVAALTEDNGAVMIPLSARTVDQLWQKMRDLLDVIQTQKNSSTVPTGAINLSSLAYTLQVGREAMEERLGFIVNSTEQLAEKLSACIDRQAIDHLEIDGVYRGQMKRNKDTLTLFSADADLQETIDKWMLHKKFPRLLELWVKGLELDWTRLYEGPKPVRMSLPVYPFAKERYWIDNNNAVQVAATAWLHPLLHANTSDLSRQRYNTRFTGTEFFLSDHQIHQQKILPAVVYLEMARAAIVHALPVEQQFGSLELRELVWGEALRVNDSALVSIAIYARDNGQIDYEIYSENHAADVGEALHCQGQALLLGSQLAPAPLDLDQLKVQMAQGGLAADDIYTAYSNIGVDFGPAHRGITTLYRGDQQLLVQLQLPSSVAENASDYFLHPSLMDSALHASLGLIADLHQLSGQPLVPFALDRLHIISGCTAEMYAWIRPAARNYSQPDLLALDIDLCDSQGNICVQFEGLCSRELTRDKSSSMSRSGDSSSTIGTVLATPEWVAASLPEQHAITSIPDGQRTIILCELPQVDRAAVKALIPAAHCLVLNEDNTSNIDARYSHYALMCVELIQQWLREKSQVPMLIQIVIPDYPEQTIFLGLSGLLKSAAQENPLLTGQVIIVESKTDTKKILADLQIDCTRQQDSIIKYEHGLRKIPGWKANYFDDKTYLSGQATTSPFKDHGVYLITGGLGGLGILFAREIIQQTSKARIILCGRSALTLEKRSLLAELSQLADRQQGNEPVYKQLDLSDAGQVKQLLKGIQNDYRQLNGIIHSAGIIADDFILKKTADDFRKVLAPKVSGTYHLDQASKDIELDFLVLFSSGASVKGNIGQADYAAANGFMDHFSHYRNHLVSLDQRRGHTLSINWPFWEEGGMRLDAANLASLQQRFGMQPINTRTGIDAFYRCLEARHSQCLVMTGELSKMQDLLLPKYIAQGVTAPSIAAHSAGDADDGIKKLRNKTQSWLCARLSSLFKLPPHEVDPRVPLEHYGIDSILAMKLTNELENTFGLLSKTLFFEYKTLEELAEYFVKNYPEPLLQQVGQQKVDITDKPAAATKQPKSMVRASVQHRFFTQEKPSPTEIAIIGLGGRYPQADDLQSFWENLKTGRDCITEIPSERWDHLQYFNPERNKPGKSYSKWGGFINDIDKFDALFFNISPREAELMDPQERLFIETVWQTIEDAGYSKENVSAQRVGVFVGVMWGQYELYGAEPAVYQNAMVPSSSYASIANRVSYFFDFHGPSLAVDTMCSSSLTAIHLASEEIRHGNIDLAVAGGVNVSAHANKYLTLAQGNFASTDGKCRSFGEGGDGYVPGEGVGAVLLKPLEKALQDGDQIYAVIKSSSINHGGKTNGYTVPNPNAQADLILEALQKANVDPATLSYIEAHGTGTSLGDPIEITGLTKAFNKVAGTATKSGLSPAPYCAVGSVKSNIGHLESAAGIAAVTKVLLQIKHQQLVPSLHAERLNPNINFANSPFYIQTGLSNWEDGEGYPRRAGVSSFGAGGANAHLILEERVNDLTLEKSTGGEVMQIFILSARDERSLCRYAENMANFLEQNVDLPLNNIAYTSQVGRTAMSQRLAILTTSTQELRNGLRQWIAGIKAKDSESVNSNTIDKQNIFYANSKHAGTNAATLIDGEAGKAFIQVIVQNRDLEKLASLWTSGVNIDWTLLYQHSRPKKVSLPTYPFAKERHWIRREKVSVDTGLTESFDCEHVSVIAEAKQKVCYIPTLRENPLTDDQGNSHRGPLLLLDVTDDWLADFAGIAGATLDKNGLIRVQTGAAYREVEPGFFTVNPEREDDFLQLIAELTAREQLPQAILHHLPESGTFTATTALSHQLNQVFYSLFHLCQTLMKQKHQQLKVLSFFNSNDATPLVFNAALGGFFKTMKQENPHYFAKVVEIRSDAAFRVSDSARIILAELNNLSCRMHEVCYQVEEIGTQKRYQRYVREFVPHCVTEKQLAMLPFKQNGTYLITGGLGGLGWIFSEYLVKNYRVNLVLLGRSTPDMAQQKKLDQLGVGGSEVLYLQADVADMHSLQSAIDSAKVKFSSIDGVIHCAGVNHDAFIIKKTRQQIERVLAAKVYGSCHLDLLTAGEDLDLFILFSSVAGAWGNPGQSDYAYANNFLDAFAEQRNRLVAGGERCGRTVSINWPFWQDGGMTLSSADRDIAEQYTGIYPLPTQDGIAYCEEILQTNFSQVVALYGIPARIAAYLTSENTAVGISAPATTAAPAVTLAEKTEAYLTALLSQEIRLEPARIESTERFEHYGVDSMMISRINASLNNDLGTLPKTLIYEHETIEDLKSYLIQHVPDALNKLFQSTPLLTVKESVVQHPQRDETFLTSHDTDLPVKIAIIGMHGTFPQSDNLDEYWENLKAGKELIDFIPADRWDYETFYNPDPERAAEGKIYSKWGGFLKDVDKFDPHFFNISPAEARIIDPQERLFLTSVWAAIEDAGYTRDSLKQKYPKARSADVGVFVGVTTNSYNLLTADEWTVGDVVSPAAVPWSIANRVSYFFDFQGPSMPVDTACSSSLVAMHLACESLKKNECQLAVAGGVNLYLHPSKYQSFCQRRMLSIGGKCHSFGAGGDGFVPGEGVGTLLLKPLTRAIADGDQIHAVINASAHDHSGRSNGYSAPNPNAQARLIAHTLAQANIQPDSISYVEGHGTGTQLGDSLEITALTQAFRLNTAQQQFCSVGSVKANVGHAESAASIAGVLKVILQMKYRQLVPSINAETTNPDINFSESPFYLQQQLAPWEPPLRPRRALINAFGAGGVNACAVLEEYCAPDRGDNIQKSESYLFILSARDKPRLKNYVELFQHYLTKAKIVDLADLCYTLQVGREALQERLAIVTCDKDELLHQLNAFSTDQHALQLHQGTANLRQKSASIGDQEKIHQMVQAHDLRAIANIWIAGAAVDWTSLHQQFKPSRISLPTYPFAKERYWVSDNIAVGKRKTRSPDVRLHPLVSYNSSTLKEISFSSLLDNKSYYAVDHQVKGSRLFPGAGFLELAYIAGYLAGEQKVTRIKDVVWMMPLSFDKKPVLVKTFLKQIGNGTEYEITSLNEEHEEVVHSEGRLIFDNNKVDYSVANPVSIDIIKGQYSARRSGEECYRLFAQYGLDYGPSFQTIEEFYVNETSALSKLNISINLKADFDQYVLHPSIIDGALQTVGSLIANAGATVPYLPFAVDEIEILKPLPQTCYAHVKFSAADHQLHGDLKQFTIQILSESGHLLVQLKNFYVRAFISPHKHLNNISSDDVTLS